MKFSDTLPSGKPIIFKGAATALITPFSPDGSVDTDAFAKLVRSQIESGIMALVVCGTTGESPTLSHGEKLDLIARAAEISNGRVPVIAGVGTNDTERTCALAIEASYAGADAVMAVTPYYNKTTEEGLILHFRAIAEASPLPVIIYNVPGRTAVRITPRVYGALAKCENIAAVKEASGDVSLTADILAENADLLTVYSGSDEVTLPILSLGGMGVISVVSNLLPAETQRLCDAFFKGDVETSRRIQLALHPLIRELFHVPNPIPVKAACAALGICSPHLRLPLSPLDDASPIVRAYEEAKKVFNRGRENS